MTKEEAIKVACGIPVTKEQHEALQFLIPELKEDKDEKIRKALVKVFEEKVQKSFEWKDGIPNNAVLDWLEKQKDAFENGRQFGIMQEQARQELECPDENQKEQKPVDYDHEMWKNCEANFEGGKKEVIEHPERYGLQKPTEWSDEDEKMRNGLISLIEEIKMRPLKRLEDWDGYLRFLKDLHPSWKPSEQEKGALRTAIHILTEERNFPKAAEQLQNILNAFEGEEPRKVWKPTERQLNKLRNIAYGIPDDDDAKVLMEILEEISKL